MDEEEQREDIIINSRPCKKRSSIRALQQHTAPDFLILVVTDLPPITEPGRWESAA